MLPASTKYLSDEFAFRKRTLFTANAPLDFTYETSCGGFEISGTEPEDCNRRIIFKIDDKLFRFGTNGLDEYDNLGQIDDILSGGNTVAELLALTDIPQFVGKKIYPIIAMDAPADSPVFPKIKIAAKVKSFNDVYTRYDYSPVYALTGNAKIIEVQASKYTRGNGIATVQCKVKNPLTGWGDWIFIEEARYKLAAAIQFRVQYILAALDGTDAAVVNDVAVRYSTNADLLSGDTQEIICLPQSCDADLGTCYALINHSKLIDCELKAYVKFAEPVKRRVNCALDAQAAFLTFNGVVDTGVAQDTIHVEQNGIPLDDFYFDTENSQLDNLSTDAAVTASYECGLAAEDWREMSLDTQSDYSSRFLYRLTESGKTVSAVKFVFKKIGGNFNETISTGTGKIQTFAIEHNATNIQCNVPFAYDGILKTVAPINQSINLYYEYSGEFPRVENYTVGWEAK